MVLDIEQFYDEDPRRQTSDEIEFGRDWYDEHHVRHEISWVADTGELYAMREPDAKAKRDSDGDESGGDSPNTIAVEILGIVPDRAEVDRRLAGWQDAMTAPNSLSWVRERLAPPAPA
jgi:hypothetical protein